MNIDRNEALKSITNRVKDATKLVIYDPYIFPEDRKPPRSKLRGIVSGKVLKGGGSPQTPAGYSSPQQAGGHPGKSSNDNYLSELISVFPEKLSTLILFYSKDRCNQELRDKFIEKCSNCFDIYYFECKNSMRQMHDRIWIVNDETSFSTGTSFNSIGSNVSFMNALPADDLYSFKELLLNEFGTQIKGYISM